MKVLETLDALVGRNSETGHESLIASYIAERCHQSGWETEIIDGNITARLAGLDESKAFILNGHMDTVPVVDGWKTSPFTLTQNPNDPDTLHGLGTSDMKSGLAVILDIAEEYGATTPPHDMWLFFTKQEETDNSGAWTVAEWFAKNHKSRYETVGGLILEPTDASFIGVGHRNGLKLDLVANGVNGHGSKEYPVQATAIGKLSRFVTDIESIQDEWKNSYSHPQLGAPTINPTNITAGIGKHNIVPSVAKAEFDLRTTPALANDLPKILTALGEKYDITITSPWEPMNTVCSPDDYIYQAVQRSAPELPLGAFPGATDLAAFLKYGIPLLIYGPGAVEAMHIPNEYVRISAIKLARQTISHIMQGY